MESKKNDTNELMYKTETDLQTSKTNLWWDFPGGAVVKNLPANAGNTGSSSGSGRSHVPRSN